LLVYYFVFCLEGLRKKRVEGRSSKKTRSWWMQKFLIPVSVQTVPNYTLLSCDVEFEGRGGKEAHSVSSK
jgi:hypothetical protein